MQKGDKQMTRYLVVGHQKSMYNKHGSYAAEELSAENEEAAFKKFVVKHGMIHPGTIMIFVSSEIHKAFGRGQKIFDKLYERR